MNEITIGDKVYISAKRAAEITGYARDYVGQLSREGHIEAKMVGRSWYIYEPSIRAHRFGAEPVSSGSTSEMQTIEDTALEKDVPESVMQQMLADTVQNDWQKPTYTSESPELLPELSPADLQELMPPAEETLTDMQTAWREWFDQKQKALEVPEIESPEVIDARNESYEAEQEAVEATQDTDEGAVGVEEAKEDTYEEIEEDSNEEVSVPLQRIVEPNRRDEVVPIHHIPQESRQPTYAPVYTHIPTPEPQGRVIQERIITRSSKKSSKKQRRATRTNAPIIAVLIGISLISIAVALIGTGYAGRYLRTLPTENNPVINFLIGTTKITR